MRLIALGAACNNACVFCAQGAMRERATPVHATSAIASITPGEVVAFVGGEPTLRGDLPELLAAAIAHGAARVILQTNARRLAYATYARSLVEAAASLSLDASLHGATIAMHDYHTSVDGSFAQTIAGLRSARSLGVRVAITTVLTRSNFRHATEIVRVAHAVGARAIQLVVAQSFGRAARAFDRIVPAIELVKEHLDRAEAEARSLGLAIGSDDFAGIGEVEQVDVSRPRVTLPVLGKPAPARAEVRSSDKRTGEELAAIFPALFTRASTED